MGTIAMLGGGSYDNGELLPVIKHIVSLVGKPSPKVLFVPTAGFDYIIGDEGLYELFRGFGAKTANLFLTDTTLTKANTEHMIMSADIIYVGGGNLKFLTETWKATGAFEIFKKAYDKGIVLSGLSSGAMCWCEEGWDDCGEDHSFMFLECVGLLPYCCCPHFDSDGWHNFIEAKKVTHRTGLAIENGCCVVVKDGSIYTVSGTDGGNAYFIDNNGNCKGVS